MHDYTEVRINGRPAIELPDGRVMLVPSGGIEGDEGEGDEKDEGAEGDAGAKGDEGDDTREAKGEGESDTDEDEHAERDASEKGDKKSKHVPYDRFAKVNAERQAWKTLGKSPKEVQDRLARLDAIEREQAERAAAEAQRRRAETGAVERGQRLDALINERYGNGTSEMLEGLAEQRRQVALAHAERGLGFLRDELEDHGLPTDADTVAEYEDAVGLKIRRDPELAAKFRDPTTQSEAVREGFKRVKSRLVDPALAAKGAAKLTAGAKRRAATLTSASSARSAEPAPLDVEQFGPVKTKDPVVRDRTWKDRIRKAWGALEAAEND